MKNKKTTILLVAIVILIPVFIVSVMGILQGTWFDAENLMERPDIEVYVKPTWQYIVYFAVLLASLCLQAALIRLYLRYSGNRHRGAIAVIVVVITILLGVTEVCMII